MNKFILILFICLFSLSSFSQDENAEASKRLQGSKELPLELNLALQTIQDSVPTKELYQTIKNIDSYARALSKEDIFLIGKIEIYKTLLKSNDVKPKAAIDGDTLLVLKSSLKKARDPFVKWFIQAMLHDSESLLSSSIFKDYVLQKNNGRLEKIEYKKIDKKVQLLNRWIAKLNPESTDFENTFKAELTPVLIECLKNIEQSYFLMAQNTTSGTIPKTLSLKDMKFFSLAEIKKKPATVKKEKTVDDILAPLTEENQATEATLPEPSKEDWLNDDNAPANLKNLPKPSDDADWLQDI
jgi:hypothetical protein